MKRPVLELTLIERDDEGETEIANQVPHKWEVCGTCDGNGTIVNPAIDGHGISREEFDEDPEFEEAYFRGDYDIRCDECGGRTTVAVVDYQALDVELAHFVALVEEQDKERAKFEAQCRAEYEAERRFGC